LTDRERQVQLLPEVSRTFALTIPQLPESLRAVVTNAYLLCRIADTIEDDASLTLLEKIHFHQQFRAVLAAQTSSQAFSQELFHKLSPTTPIAERELIQNVPVVIRCLRSFTPTQQASLQRCVNIMSTGMPEFQRIASLAGLENMASIDKYCYYVAGVVGEMLTELFCDYSPKIAHHKDQLMSLAVSFGQGLQMTNILKDFWEDWRRGICWLPRDVFALYGLDLSAESLDKHPQAFHQVLRHMVLIAHGHLQNALQYSLLIPRYETGIRRFTLWAIGLAILTLRNIYRHPAFKSGNEIKVSRRLVKATILVSNVSCHNNHLLNYLFTWLSREFR
jgi:farnesyl-diphosphate farnesyltransferase